MLTVASRLIHPYSTDNKTSRLMVKRFSTVKDTQRFTKLHGEEKRDREIEVSRRKGEIKRREIDLSITLFPKCSPQPGISKEIHSVG